LADGENTDQNQPEYDYPGLSIQDPNEPEYGYPGLSIQEYEAVVYERMSDHPDMTDYDDTRTTNKECDNIDSQKKYYANIDSVRNQPEKTFDDTRNSRAALKDCDVEVKEMNASQYFEFGE
jgi:hypothetical protein